MSGQTKQRKGIGLGFLTTVIDTLARRSFDIVSVRDSQVSLLRGRANTIAFNKTTVPTALPCSNCSGMVASHVASHETIGNEILVGPSYEDLLSSTKKEDD